MNDLDLYGMESRLISVTAGPWRVVPVEGRADVRSAATSGWDARGLAVATAADSSFGALSVPDAEFIAHARVDIPALIAEVRRLREEAQHWEGMYSDALGVGR